LSLGGGAEKRRQDAGATSGSSAFIIFEVNFCKRREFSELLSWSSDREFDAGLHLFGGRA